MKYVTQHLTMVLMDAPGQGGTKYNAQRGLDLPVAVV